MDTATRPNNGTTTTTTSSSSRPNNGESDEETFKYNHLYSPFMVEKRNKHTYIYKQVNKTHRK